MADKPSKRHYANHLIDRATAIESAARLLIDRTDEMLAVIPIGARGRGESAFMMRWIQATTALREAVEASLSNG
jgi:hypothetical protein